jgi:uncharacterized protein YgbK (DUF1537 family)
LRTALLLQPPTPDVLARFPELDAVGVAGDSRAMTPEEMERHLPPVFNALADCGAPIVHYKVCSTFDSAPGIGSIGRTIEIAQAIFRNRFTPIVGSTPALQRYCLFGHLFARSGTDGRMYRLDRHPIMSVHPVTPADDSDLLVQLGRQTTLPIARLDFPAIEPGLDSAAAALNDVLAAKPQAVLIDSASAQQLTTVGGLLERLAGKDAPLFIVGPSGVEYALTQWWRERGALGASDPAYENFDEAGAVLAISGSASTLSMQQIDAALAAGFHGIAVDAVALLDDQRWPAVSQAIMADVLAMLTAGRSVILHTARGPADPRIEQTLDALRARGSSTARARQEGGRLLGQRLGHIARSILQQRPLKRLLLSGGDTSSQVTQVLAPDGLVVAARLTRGAPLCRFIAPGQSWLDGVEVALKGGQMGDANFFETARAGTRMAAVR